MSILSQVICPEASTHKNNLSVTMDLHVSARLQKVIKGPLGEVEVDIASERDAKMLNNVQKRFQVLYCAFCKAHIYKHIEVTKYV